MHFGGLDFKWGQSTSDRHLIETEKTQQIWKWKKNPFTVYKVLNKHAVIKEGQM